MPLRKLLLLAATLAGVLGTINVNAAAPMAPAPARPVDAARLFTGTWIEIGRRPMKLTDGCVAGTTTYSPQGGSKIMVRDTCNKTTPAGKLKAIGGPGVITDPGTNTKLHVSYKFLGFVPIARDYWILDHDAAYTWFISANPAFTDLWIYTRTTRPDSALVAALVAKAKAMGYDVSKLDSRRNLERRNAVVEARWNGTLIASSDDTVVVEGNHYFPADAVDAAFLQPSSTTTNCPWKGTAHYYSLHVDGADNRDAAWYYPEPKAKAENIRNRIAFWKGVKVG